MTRFLFTVLALIGAVFGKPVGGTAQARSVDLNNLTSPYTITAFVPWNCAYNGAKINNLNLLQAKVRQYCPFTSSETGYCPNGTDMAFASTLSPLTTVPGGQDLYVNVDGQMAITVQHSHSIPPGAWWEYYGWTWTALPVRHPPLLGCPRDDPRFNCSPPTGFFNFRAPGADVGGVAACPNKYYPETTSLYAITPQFNRTDCVPLAGLGTHPYSGPNPPVWAY